jgi:photosystem II oxygen-evolving enhancer protein 1
MCLGHGVQYTNEDLEDRTAETLAMLLLASANPSKSMKTRRDVVSQGMATGLAAASALGGGMQGAQAGPFTREEIASLTYEQIKGTGLANTCPVVEAGTGANAKISVGGLKRMSDFCLEPTFWAAIEDGKVDVSKIMTRQTYTLTGMEGTLTNEGGKLTFREEDGIDYAPSTIQRPSGERVPFLFTTKNLVAQAKDSSGAIEPGFVMSGTFKVPSYRTGLFLDPKGRGMVTGYDQAQALPALQAGGDAQLFAENNKVFDVLDGQLELKVTSVNAELGEIGGVFVQQQPSDTDMGGKKPTTLQMKGSWFATVQ